MSTDPLDRLRASNPVPHGSSAPPLERVLERMGADEPGRRRWSAWTGALLPALGAVAAIAVVAMALVLVRGHHRGVVRRSGPAAPSSAPALSRGGMLGLVGIDGVAFASPSDGTISLQQCLGCRNGNPTRHASYRTWQASTADGGASWRLTRRPYYVYHPRFQGSDGWAEGLQTQSNGGGTARFYVSHDAGRNWTLAPSAGAAIGDGNLSVGGGEVWAIGSALVPPFNVRVLRAPANGNRLVAAAAQPVSGDWTNVEALSAGPHSAYVNNPDARGQTFVTHNDGRSWQRIAPPCPRGASGGLATGGVAGSLWATCATQRGNTLRRSADGGRSWHGLAGRYAGVVELQPASGQVAWGLVTSRGAVVRTADGGATWSTVWSLASSQPRSLRSRPPLAAAAISHTPALTVQDATSASLLMIVTRGRVGLQARLTNLVVYRTSDGGKTWHPSVVPLPAR